MVSQQSDQWQKELNPNPMAGQNHGAETNQEGRYELTAYDLIANDRVFSSCFGFGLSSKV